MNRIRAEKIMLENRLEALIATSPINVFYSSDMCPYGDAFALLPLERSVEPAIITSISAPIPVIVMSPPWIRDVRYYGEFYTETRWAEEPLDKAEKMLVDVQESWEITRRRDPSTLLIELLEERGLIDCNIGIDESTLPKSHPFWSQIKVRLPAIETVSASRLFSKIRMIKTKEEIKRIENAVKITEKAWEAALASAREGMTEKEFAFVFESTMLKEGGRPTSHMGAYGAPIAFGRRTAFVDLASPSYYKLRRGDLLRFDGGCSYMGYGCDMARTAVLGEPSDKTKSYYNALSEGVQLAVEMAKPGEVASEVFDAVVERVRKSGIPHYRRHHVGHGWGLGGYNPPLIGPRDDAELEEGMLLCLETPYYEVGFGGLMLEDVIVVKKGEPRYLTKFDRRLYPIGAN